MDHAQLPLSLPLCPSAGSLLHTRRQSRWLEEKTLRSIQSLNSQQPLKRMHGEGPAAALLLRDFFYLSFFFFVFLKGKSSSVEEPVHGRGRKKKKRHQPHLPRSVRSAPWRAESRLPACPRCHRLHTVRTLGGIYISVATHRMLRRRGKKKRLSCNSGCLSQ